MNTVFVNISKTISSASDSFLLVMSHLRPSLKLLFQSVITYLWHLYFRLSLSFIFTGFLLYLSSSRSGIGLHLSVLFWFVQDPDGISRSLLTVGPFEWTWSQLIMMKVSYRAVCLEITTSMSSCMWYVLRPPPSVFHKWPFCTNL